jgi:hypothetical protein
MAAPGWPPNATWSTDAIAGEDLYAWASTQSELIVTQPHELRGCSVRQIATLKEYQKYHRSSNKDD